MKDNELFAAMGNIDEELIDEALNAPKKRKLPVVKFTAAAAVLVFIALSAAVLVNAPKQPDIIAESRVSEVQLSEKTDGMMSETKGQTEESPGFVSTGQHSVPSASAQESTDTRTEVETSTASSENTGETVNPNDTETSDISEPCDILGTIIWEGKRYIQLLNGVEYTLDKEIGYARDFVGTYTDMDDNSKVYSVKEDSSVIALVFEHGGIIYLSSNPDGVIDGYFYFSGLRVDAALKSALISNDGKVYSVYVTRPDSDDMYGFVYNGRTVNDISEEMYECQKMNGILSWISGQITDELFMSGRDDKYLDTAKQIKENYRISGTDQYDTEKAKEDALTYGTKYKILYNEYQEALNAFLKEKIKNVYDILISNGIKAELVNEFRCQAEMTKEQFVSLAASNSYLDEYAFGLLGGEYVTDDSDA